MLTVSKLAKRFNISRTTLLYYEQAELLFPATRSDNGYRWYGEQEIERLKRIVNYRSFGISITQIKHLLDKTEDNDQEKILRKQFDHLEQEIRSLRKQQKAIVTFMDSPEFANSQSMTKEKWTAILRASGMNDDDMMKWHRQFEKMEPQAHQAFLESLNIPKTEIRQIRKMSR
ncbi:MerR family transcriptional regulator [Aliikangiella marina]|uniref:MerR family transcriptional regulator n=1 Tax=Aliikangiella marina TaxID=1712262 RepID=A0A545T4N6_9GAMM|nr:MerR family transcriptional regulator [Aliikangiella marina]TQV72191.1 MerR family transcriptional regulator [Aliikangiella marina]